MTSGGRYQIPDHVTFASAAGREATEAILRCPAKALICLDYDGTLAPIVAKPEDARPQPGMLDILQRLIPHVGGVVVVTGRPVQVILDLGGFARLTETQHLRIYGQYGQETWDGITGRLTVPPPPPTIAAAKSRLADLLDQVAREGIDVEGVGVEDKGLAVVVHTRRNPRPGELLEKLAPHVQRIAEELGLSAQRGRNAIELRNSSIDKGDVVRDLLRSDVPETGIFCGDDLGDLPAFDAVSEWQRAGHHGAQVVSASGEVPELVSRADIVCDGPAGILAWLTMLADGMESQVSDQASWM